MRRSVDEFRRSAKDVESRLDMLQWKVETLSQNNVTAENSVLHSPQSPPLTICQLLKDVTKVKTEYLGIKQELKDAVDQQNQACNELHERVDSVKERILRLRSAVGDHSE